MEKYRYVATSREGFIQQLAGSYLRHGYWFFVRGVVPEQKNSETLDRKLLDKYGIETNKKQRYRRKRQGLANLQYLRFDREWVMLSTKGKHVWFEEEAANIRDVRRQPLLVEGYSLSVVRGGYRAKRESSDPNGPPERDEKLRVRVQIARDAYRDLQAELLLNARSRRPEWYQLRFWHCGFEPYAPVRKQLLELLRQVNAARRAAGLEKLPSDVIRYRRQPVKVFEEPVRERAA